MASENRRRPGHVHPSPSLSSSLSELSSDPNHDAQGHAHRLSEGTSNTPPPLSTGPSRQTPIPPSLPPVASNDRHEHEPTHPHSSSTPTPTPSANTRYTTLDTHLAKLERSVLRRLHSLLDRNDAPSSLQRFVQQEIRAEVEKIDATLRGGGVVHPALVREVERWVKRGFCREGAGAGRVRDDDPGEDMGDLQDRSRELVVQTSRSGEHDDPTGANDGRSHVDDQRHSEPSHDARPSRSRLSNNAGAGDGQDIATLASAVGALALVSIQPRGLSPSSSLPPSPSLHERPSAAETHGRSQSTSVAGKLQKRRASDPKKPPEGPKQGTWFRRGVTNLLRELLACETDGQAGSSVARARGPVEEREQVQNEERRPSGDSRQGGRTPPDRGDSRGDPRRDGLSRRVFNRSSAAAASSTPSSPTSSMHTHPNRPPSTSTSARRSGDRSASHRCNSEIGPSTSTNASTNASTPTTSSSAANDNDNNSTTDSDATTQPAPIHRRRTTLSRIRLRGFDVELVLEAPAASGSAIGSASASAIASSSGSGVELVSGLGLDSDVDFDVVFENGHGSESESEQGEAERRGGTSDEEHEGGSASTSTPPHGLQWCTGAVGSEGWGGRGDERGGTGRNRRRRRRRLVVRLAARPA